MNRKSIYLKLIAALACTTFFYACSSKPKIETTSDSVQSETATQAKGSIIGNKPIKNVVTELVTYDKEDFYTNWKTENPSYIELKETTSSLKGSGAEINEGKVAITAAGTYVISGKLNNGQIIVDVKDKGTVRLVLNGVEINSSDNAPIYIKNADKTIISLEAGTENSIVDGAKYILEDDSADEPSAAIFSKDNLVINGTGNLIVNGNYNDGITCKDDLKIMEGNIKITSIDDGLIGRDILAVKNGNITIEAGGDAVKSTNNTDITKGIVALENGTFNLKAKNDGIQAETAVLILDGSFNIISGGGNVNATKKSEEKTLKLNGDKNNTTSETETESAKAIKAAADIGITNGTFNIDSADDSMHSNNNIVIEGGSFTITSGDDGIHADSTLSIKDGKINIMKSYEGIESSVITISSGEIHVTSTDDGINVAGGADASSINGRPGENRFISLGNNKLNINGGYIVVNASGDGLDANGSIYMNKGTVIVNGPTSNGNAALDYDGTFEMSGGFLVCSGSSGMAQAPSDSSTQYSIIMNYPKAQTAGTIINLQDDSGNSIVTFAPAKEYQAVVISSPELKKDSNYVLYSDGTSTGIEKDGLYTNGKYENGTKTTEFKISNLVTWLNESGVTTSRSPMQGGGPGGKSSPRGERPADSKDKSSYPQPNKE